MYNLSFQNPQQYYLLWLLGRGLSSLTILQQVIRMDELVKINYENQRPTVLVVIYMKP